MDKQVPSMDIWLEEGKKQCSDSQNGMFLIHNGVVRKTSRAEARQGARDKEPVTGMRFSYDRQKVEEAIESTKERAGIFYVRVWLNEGVLKVGEDIMYVLIGGDIRPRVVDALQYLVGRIKETCVTEEELFDSLK